VQGTDSAPIPPVRKQVSKDSLQSMPESPTKKMAPVEELMTAVTSSGLLLEAYPGMELRHRGASPPV
jgi:hypothetical protein